MDFKKLRVEKGLSQEDIATYAGISVYAYQLIERGSTKKPRPETLKKLKEILTDERPSN